MAEQTYTPGPWRVDATKALGPMGIYSETAQQELSGICWFEYARRAINGLRMPREEIEANARLIAASPDHALLLRCILASHARWEPFREGATHGEVCVDGLRHTTELDPFGCPVLTDGIRAALAKVEGG